MSARYLLCLLLLPGFAQAAEVYRCVGSAGETEFSQRPCSGEPSRTIEIATQDGPPAAGLRSSERAWLAGRARLRQARNGGRHAARATTQGSGESQARHAYQCERKRHQLDAVQARLRRGYKPARGERLRQRRRAYADYLSAFCP